MKFRFDEIAFNSTLKKKPVEEDKIHYIGLEHIEPGNFSITEWGSDVAPVGEKLIMKKGDILFGKRRAYQRKVAIAPFDGIFSAHGMVLRPKTDVIDADFFPLFISSDTFMETAMRISVGGLSPTINWKDLKEQEFELPSLEEQQTIAKKAWAAYRLKEAYQRLLAATDEMVKSQFIEMTSKCQSSVKLSSIATYSIGLTYAPEDVNSDGIIVLRSGNIQDGSITLEDIVRVNKPIKDSLYVKKGNILMCSRNGSASLVGKTAIVGDYPERMTFGAFMTLIKTDIPEYINAFFSTPSFRYQVSMGKSSTMNQITQKMLDSIELPLVSVSEQEQFAEIVRQSDKSKFELKRAIEAVDKVIKSLING